ncbi:TomO hydrophobic C-terminal domain-containing protein [Wolbachia endosymbiont (group B) of Melanostoma mellinum]|uniref:TomO hydrophobic C-terminal domain-containing protein n=1 Tax=Wolbachia endosymbiont (group B) of Melanostoma mellinum TaxID=2954030 RepID=UPI0022302335|nr:hypothetical protein [Wolbachia endosymbiont (group B) of Melanostoma mellinum]
MNFIQYTRGNRLRLHDQEVDINKLISFLQENKNIIELSLSSCKIGNEGAKALANSNLTNLTELDLHRNNIGKEGAKALANSNLTNLTKLDLWFNDIGKEGAKALANLTKLTQLNLADNDIGKEGAKALANLTKLTQLNLSYNNIGNEGAKALANLTKLTRLDLSYNNIGAEGVEALANGNLTKLTRLYLNDNNIDAKGAKALAESEKYCEFIDKITQIEGNNEPMGFCKRLKKLWSQARAKSKSNVRKLDESTIRSLFFDLAQHGYTGGIEVLLDDYDKYPFLINSRNEQGHTLSHFYNHDPGMQRFFFERGMIPKQRPEQKRDDLRIVQDRQSVHASPAVKKTNFLAKKLVESTKADEEQLKQAATSYVESIELLKQYQNDPIRLNLLSVNDKEKRSVMEKTLGDNPVPNDKDFIGDIIDKVKEALKKKYLKKNSHDEYDQGYPTQGLQYDYTKDDAKITIPESIGRIKLLIDNFSIPLKEKKELLVTLIAQNQDLVMSKLSSVKRELGDFDTEQLDKTKLHTLLNDIDDNKKVDVLFKEISDLDIEKIWREQKEFILLKQIYIASTTYGEGSSACIQGTWSQIINSIDEISSEILEQYDHYLEEELKLEEQKNAITEENIKPFLEGLAKNLVQHAESHPELKEALKDFAVCNVNIDDPEEITFEQQKILAEINKYFSEYIKNALPNYNRNIPNNDEYKLIIEKLSEVKEMQDFAQEPSNQQENTIRETEAQIDENSEDKFFDAENYNKSRATIRESDTDEEFKDVNESIFLEENNTQLVPERLHSETSVVATDQTNGIQNNNQQPGNLNNDASRSKEKNKRPTVCAFTLAIAGIISGIAIAVYSGMLAVGIAVGACCLVAAAIIYCCSGPSNSLEKSSAEAATNKCCLEAPN